MKEEIHELIDGELPDPETAELLHRLSVDSAERAMFREQMRLQRNLYRNERHGGMTPGEEAEMLQRIAGAAGGALASGRAWSTRGAVALLALGLVAGSGVGYASRGMIDPAPPPQVVVKQLAPPPPHVVYVQPLDRDSLISAVKDSLTKVRAATTRVTTTPARRPAKARSSSSSVDDPTGYHAAQEAAKKKRRNR